MHSCAKAQNVPEEKGQKGKGIRKKKSHKIYRDREVMRGEREQGQIYITLRVFLKDALTETCICWRTRIGPVTSWSHDGKTQATPPSLLAFALPRIFHCWQESTMRSVECQYDIVPTLIWQQTHHGVRVGYDNRRGHAWPAEWTMVVTTLHTNENNSSTASASCFGKLLGRNRSLEKRQQDQMTDATVRPLRG